MGLAVGLLLYKLCCPCCQQVQVALELMMYKCLHSSALLCYWLQVALGLAVDLLLMASCMH